MGIRALRPLCQVGFELEPRHFITPLTVVDVLSIALIISARSRRFPAGYLRVVFGCFGVAETGGELPSASPKRCAYFPKSRISTEGDVDIVAIAFEF